MQILAIDPGIDNLGLALLSFNRNHFNIVKVEHDKYNRDKMIRLINSVNPDYIVIEQQSKYSKIKPEMFYLLGYIHAKGLCCRMVQPIAKSYAIGKTTYKQRKELSVEMVLKATNEMYDPNVSDAINLALKEYFRLHPDCIDKMIRLDHTE
jgi:hypothetical protein